MARTRFKIVGRADSGSHFGLPHAVLNSPNYKLLSAHAVKLLCDLGAQFKGYNNGDQCATWSLMCWRWLKTDHLCWFKTDQGWRPRGTPLGCG